MGENRSANTKSRQRQSAWVRIVQCINTRCCPRVWRTVERDGYRVNTECVQRAQGYKLCIHKKCVQEYKSVYKEHRDRECVLKVQEYKKVCTL